MNIYKLNKIIFNKQQSASAIILVMFILSGIMIVVFSGASIVLSGLKMSKLQSESMRAYYKAESGAERLLYQFRKDDLLTTLGSNTPQEDIFNTADNDNGNYYGVNYNSYSPLTFTSIGSYYRTRRSVEISFY